MLINGWLQMRVTLLIFTLFVFCGCDPAAMKRVRLGLAAPAGSPAGGKSASVSVESPEVQQALGIVDSVVRRYGLESGGEYPDHKADVVCWYGFSVPQAQASKRPSLTCRVYLKGRDLEVLFVEFPKSTSSPDVLDMRDDIRSQFQSQFGKERVR